MTRIQRPVVHYSEYDPRTTTGGVETFARNLELIFEDVGYMTPETLDVEQIRRQNAIVICDNQFVLDWPKEIGVVGFQHGVGAVKFKATHSPSHWLLSRRQGKAARRPNTLWVACAEWIARTFDDLHDSGAEHVIYHPIDVERFDGKLSDPDSRLILHDARLKHKGRDLMPHIERAYPDWQFEPLACEPADVPDRMRAARAFIHLSRYEGNSIVCNEAMAMDLPCFFTRVGLMQDSGRPEDVWLIDPDEAFKNRSRLHEELGRFLSSLGQREYHPRQWVLDHATREISRDSWASVVSDFELRFG